MAPSSSRTTSSAPRGSRTLLVALRDKFANANWVFALPDLLKAVGETVQTDFPRSQAGNLASLLPLISGGASDVLVLSLPDLRQPPAEPLVNYLLIPKRRGNPRGDGEALRARSAGLVPG